MGGLFVYIRRSKELKIIIIKNKSPKNVGLVTKVLDRFDLTYDFVDLAEVTEIKNIEKSNLIILISLLKNTSNHTEELSKLRALIKVVLEKKIPIIGIGTGIQVPVEWLGVNLVITPQNKLEIKGENQVSFLNLNKEHNKIPIFEAISDSFIVFQFYCDTFESAKKFDLLVPDQDYINQLIKFGDNLYGFQINFELTEDLLEYFLNLLPELNISSKERIEKDYTEIKERYLEKGERIFTNYLKLINLIKQIEVELIENSVKSENKKKSDNLPPHSEDKPKIIEGERSTSINLDDLKKKMESKLTKS